MVTIEAAGGVLWRTSSNGVETALVHRPKYDDWSVPKGMLDPGEHVLLAALREVQEETSWSARPGLPLGEERYLVDGDVPKRVRYWSLEAVQGEFVPHREIDQLRWVTPYEALDVLPTNRGREAVDAFLQAPLRTWAAIVVRHADAGDRQAWQGEDRQRPLDVEGRRQANALTQLLACYQPESLHAADNVRCRDTLAPLSVATGLPVVSEPLLGEAGHREEPDEAAARLRALALHGPLVACSQRGPLAALVQRVATDLGAPSAPMATPEKGAALVLHLTRDPVARVVTVEALEAP